jgi:hypothetical protein
MKCPGCSLNLRGKKIDYDYSDKSFIGAVILCKSYSCKKCNKEYFYLGDDYEINRQICDLILTQDLLRRNQLKYIVDQIFCESIFCFAKRINQNPEFVKDLISYKKIISKPLSDQIMKMIFLKFKTPSIMVQI